MVVDVGQPFEKIVVERGLMARRKFISTKKLIGRISSMGKADENLARKPTTSESAGKNQVDWSDYN